MIQFTKSYQASDGNVFGTLRLAQEHELKLILKDILEEWPALASDDYKLLPSISARLIENAGQVVDILTTKANSKPRARAIHGGRKPRKTKTESVLIVPNPTKLP